MSSVWLLCAARSNVRELTEEVERRCPRAQLMRMGCEQGISDVARVLLQVAVGAAVSFDEPATAPILTQYLSELRRIIADARKIEQFKQEGQAPGPVFPVNFFRFAD